MNKRLLITLSIICLILFPACGNVSKGEAMPVNIVELIKKESRIQPDTNVEINDVTDRSTGKAGDLRIITGAWRFNFDPVPYDVWIFDGNKVFPVHEIITAFNKSKVVPKSKKEAEAAARFAAYAQTIRCDNRIEMKSAKVKEDKGRYDVKVKVIANRRFGGLDNEFEYDISFDGKEWKK